MGVNSDELVKQHKSRSVMNHAERCEAVRHCRWVDEVVQEAPWIIDSDFIDKWEIDYVAHDEDPYAASGHDDVYGYVKSQGPPSFIFLSFYPRFLTTLTQANSSPPAAHPAFPPRSSSNVLSPATVNASSTPSSRRSAPPTSRQKALTSMTAPLRVGLGQGWGRGMLVQD